MVQVGDLEGLKEYAPIGSRWQVTSCTWHSVSIDLQDEEIQLQLEVEHHAFDALFRAVLLS